MPARRRARGRPLRRVLRIQRSREMHRDRWDTAVDPRGRLAAAVSYLAAAAHDAGHLADAEVDQAARDLWQTAELVNTEIARHAGKEANAHDEAHCG